MTQPLNLCRQMRKQAMNRQFADSRTQRAAMSNAMYAAHCEKFILPIDGCVFDDPRFTAIEDESDIRKLPFPSIALEFETNPNASASAMIIFASQDKDYPGILFSISARLRSNGVWCPFPVACINSIKTSSAGRTTSLSYPDDAEPDEIEAYNAAITVIFGFINVVSCSNVRSEKIEAKQGAKIKGALPFDDYHVLSIGKMLDGRDPVRGPAHDTRSPREHLRRGHIRRYASGLKIWINSMVVNAGTVGKIKKDYAIG